MNVLVYSGPGTTIESVKHCLATFRRLLSPNYAVMPVTADAIIKEPWTSTCALLCIPGGADLGFCKALNGVGNQRISQYVRRGGKYIGFCAGGYFASASIEFEKGILAMEVSGKRELKFFPGLCRGTAFKGFKYNSEAGARACAMDVSPKLVEMGAPVTFSSYYNGGGVFVDAETFSAHGVKVLASYQDPVELDGNDSAAVVGCTIGLGYVLLIQTHPEFEVAAMKKRPGLELSSSIIKILEENEGPRLKFLKSCFDLLGLKSSSIETTIPPLSDLHLSCLDTRDIMAILDQIHDLIDRTSGEGGYGTIRGENDIFFLEDADKGVPHATVLPDDVSDIRDEDQEKPKFRLKIHATHCPTTEITPMFCMTEYFDYIASERRQYSSVTKQFGSPLLYGEVVTSTNTILDKNFKLLQRLPSGLTAVASIQTAGRGRGNNVWVSPIGMLAFSTLIRHKLQDTTRAPVVFLQYLVALAIVDSIKRYGLGYEEMPVFLKWPNDIYSRSISKSGLFETGEKGFVKIGGILVNASFAEEEFLLVVGSGINTTNDAPTTSLNLLLKSINQSRALRNLSPLPGYQHEKLLAKMVVTFEAYYERFLKSGFQVFEAEYYRNWLHSGQIVNVETAGNVRARVRGVSMQDGMLVVDELNEYNDRTGREYSLQTDGNSFDFFNGLLKRKI